MCMLHDYIFVINGMIILLSLLLGKCIWKNIQVRVRECILWSEQNDQYKNKYKNKNKNKNKNRIENKKLIQISVYASLTTVVFIDIGVSNPNGYSEIPTLLINLCNHLHKDWEQAYINKTKNH